MNKTMIAIMASAALTASLSSAPASATTDPYLGEIMPVAFTFCPRGWANADGTLLAINSNQALFSLYGTTFGGDGRTTFALPEMRGRTPIGNGTGAGLTPRPLGSQGGAETTTLIAPQLPSHSHTANILTAHTQVADTKNPKGNAFARSGDLNYENTAPPSSDLADAMHSGTLVVFANGGGQAHNNMSPYLTIRYCVAMQGIFPSRN